MRTMALKVAVATCLTAFPAAALTLDFQSLETANAVLNQIASPYSEDGFTLATPGQFEFGVWGTGNVAYPGSTALFINTTGATATLTQDSGNPFTVTSIRLVELFDFGSATSVSFTGNLDGGGTVMQSFTLDGTFGFQTFSFPGSFTNLASLVWAQNGSASLAHQFDDIVLTDDGPVTIPLPAPAALLLSGLALLGLVRRRRA